MYDLVKETVNFFDTYYNPEEAHLVMELLALFAVDWLERRGYLEKRVENGGYSIKWIKEAEK